jgi:AcrR family transcriptional regulator
VERSIQQRGRDRGNASGSTVQSDGQPTDRWTEIVNRAAARFDVDGYHRTSMEDIANAVGIRKPTLYHYFASKEDILISIHQEFLRVLLDRLDRRAELSLSPSQQLLEVIADILELMDTHRGHVRVFFEHHGELSGEPAEEIRHKRDLYRQRVEDMMREGIEAGEFRAVNISLSSLALFGMCNWAYQWYRPNQALRAREIAYVFWDIFTSGIRAAPARG